MVCIQWTWSARWWIQFTFGATSQRLFEGCEIFIHPIDFTLDGNRNARFECERRRLNHYAVYQNVRNLRHYRRFEGFRKQSFLINYLEKFHIYRVNFPTLYREVFAALIDAMHRKFDKNAQLSNQLKTWDNSIRIINKLLAIAKVADLSRVFFFYLKVTHLSLPCSYQNTNEKLIISEHTCIHQAILAIWNGHHWIQYAAKVGRGCWIFAITAKFHTLLTQFVLPFKGIFYLM